MDQRITVPGLRVTGKIDGDAAHLHVEGEVDHATAQAVRDAVGEALDAGVHEVVLDLGGVAFLDSTGLSVLLRAARDIDRRRARLRTLCPAGSEALLVIELARVAQLLKLDYAPSST
jgi:anti-sigma B factor antagonist